MTIELETSSINEFTRAGSKLSLFVDKYVERPDVAEKALFIDLNRLVMARYIGLDPAEIKAKYFTPADNGHTSPAGAELNAGAVVEGIRNLKECPLTTFLTSSPASAK